MKQKKGLIASLVIVLIFYFFVSRPNKQSFAKELSKEECILVVQVPPIAYTSVTFRAKGYNPITNKPCECNHHNRWWSSYKKEIDVGDTIVKKKGELIFSIHKKDSIIIHKYKL